MGFILGMQGRLNTQKNSQYNPLFERIMETLSHQLIQEKYLAKFNICLWENAQQIRQRRGYLQSDKGYLLTLLPTLPFILTS